MTARELVEVEEPGSYKTGDLVTPRKTWPTKASKYSGNIALSDEDGHYAGEASFKRGELLDIEVIADNGPDDIWLALEPFPKRPECGEDFLMVMRPEDVDSEFTRATHPHIRKAAKRQLSGPPSR